MPDDYFNSNKSLRRKFFLNQPMKLSGGAGLFLETKQNITIIAAFNSLNGGAAGGLLSSHIYQLLDEIVSHLKIFSPSIILEQLETKVSALFPAGMPFTGGVRAAIIAYDNSAKTITYSGANFPIFILESAKAQKHSSSNNSLLLNEDGGEFTNEVTEITKGMRFYLSTDAFWAQRGGHDFKPFGETGFITALESTSNQSMERQSEVLGKIYSDWMGGGDQEGDLLVFGFGF